MTPNQVREMINNTCTTMYNYDLASHYSSIVSKVIKDGTRVSWASRDSGANNMHAWGALDQYIYWVANGEYTCLLFDYSIVRAAYTINGNRVVGHNLTYWPFPVNPKAELNSVQDALDALEICYDSAMKSKEVCELVLRSPMRFDYAPERAGVEHPEVHMHMQFHDARMFVKKPMCFNSFMKMICRTFYSDMWSEKPFIKNLYEHEIDMIHGNINPEKYCMQLKW